MNTSTKVNCDLVCLIFVPMLMKFNEGVDIVRAHRWFSVGVMLAQLWQSVGIALANGWCNVKFCQRCAKVEPTCWAGIGRLGQRAKLHWANVKLQHWANKQNNVGPTLSQHVGPTEAQWAKWRWANDGIQRWPNAESYVGHTLAQRTLADWE